ncbi:MAG: riboflavin biosynthesis protein RibF [bacterium]|jgi:riboflavin kinase/FMN adenylyltransferase
MEVLEWRDGHRLPGGNNFAAIGTFDGVHIGHRSVIHKMLATAADNSGRKMVVTFEPHPREVTNGANGPALLTAFPDKARLIEQIGADTLMKIPFTAAVARMAPKDFVRDILCRDLRIVYACVGFNYRFGRGGSGDTAVLRTLGEEYGITVDIVEPVAVDGVIVSSTTIRGLLETGDVEAATRYLGSFPLLSGRVVAGAQRGRKLGFPTANIQVDPRLIQPAAGVYAAYLGLNGRRYQGIANIGYSPTFYAAGMRQLRLEVHIFDFSRDIYGETVTVEFVSRIRSEQVFRSGDELSGQLNLDRAIARRRLQEDRS